MRNALALLLIPVCVAVAAHVGTARLESPCYEDSVLMWDGTTNAHTACVPLDDLIGG